MREGAKKGGGRKGAGEGEEGSGKGGGRKGAGGGAGGAREYTTDSLIAGFNFKCAAVVTHALCHFLFCLIRGSV